MTSPKAELDEHIRNLIIRHRRDPQRWGKKHGLTQREAADAVGISVVWWRQIETGYTPSAGITTLADMCDFLGIDPTLLRALGYGQVADAMDAIVMMRENAIPDHVIDESRSRPRHAEAHLRATPGLEKDEADTLVSVYRALRDGHGKRGDFVGKEIWRRPR